MKIVLIAATGQCGSRVLTELLSRGHAVTAVVRNASKLNAAEGVTVAQSDLSDVAQLASILQGAEVVISAYGPPGDQTDLLVETTQRIVEAVAAAGAGRLIVVGGAGSLEVAPGVTLIDSGYLPPEYLPIAVSHSKALALLKTSAIDWTYFSPAGYFEPGERTGTFRLGTTNLIMNEKGDSRISMEDYAIALVDEVESPKHRKAQFSIGY